MLSFSLGFQRQALQKKRVKTLTEKAHQKLGSQAFQCNPNDKRATLTTKISFEIHLKTHGKYLRYIFKKASQPRMQNFLTSRFLARP